MISDVYKRQVLGLGEQELRIGGYVVALVGGDQFTALGLVGILPVGKAVFEGLGDSFPSADMVDDQARGGRGSTSSLFRKPAASQPPVSWWDKVSQRFTRTPRRIGRPQENSGPRRWHRPAGPAPRRTRRCPA